MTKKRRRFNEALGYTLINGRWMKKPYPSAVLSHDKRYWLPQWAALCR